MKKQRKKRQSHRLSRSSSVSCFDNSFGAGELKKSIEMGEPTEMIAELLQDLASKIMVDQRADVSGLDLINQVIQDPSVLWRKFFFTTVN